ncbi:unnamed protein product, partial [Medioppia subpectinata]
FSSKVDINEGISLLDLLPEDKDLFYKYMGSLTTPPCSESAEFIIFVDPIYLNPNQISQFRRISGEPMDGIVQNLDHNRRDQQSINDRIVWLSDPFSIDNIDFE